MRETVNNRFASHIITLANKNTLTETQKIHMLVRAMECRLLKGSRNVERGLREVFEEYQHIETYNALNGLRK